MFAKLSVVTTLALVPWAQALLLQIPVGWHSSSNVNISWSHQATDPPFTLQLFSIDAFHDTFSIANNVDPTTDFTAFQLGVVPEGQYTLRAINVTNTGQIYDETPSFTVGAPLPDSTTTTSSTSSARPSSTGTGSSAAGTTTVRPTSGSTTGFGVTVSASSTTPAISDSATPTTSGSSDGSSTNFNGAASLSSITPLALAALGIVAGAAVAL
ncbi:hypothetical protein C8Q80DRAFT_1128924 [Daedaleopsis nitida]|nr:hypothetical protein C8Q80DRAFT_1128924 [Daedaleopsis nitida]